MSTFKLAPLLPADTLDKREQLLLKPAPVTLTGRYVRLEPLVVERDAGPLFALSNGSSITLGERSGERSIEAYDAEALVWRYMFDSLFEHVDEFAARLQAQVDVPDALCLCVIDIDSGQPVGVTNFMNNQPAHLKIELGGIWYSPIVQRTPANTEATYLMLRHAFDLGYRRLEWKCDALNERSRRAALRMGFTFEGIQEAHMIIKGRNRDTAWFRILETEWPAVKETLERLLYDK